jgi:ABC-type glycerol-3-phosphate transport system substrate-binding protein
MLYKFKYFYSMSGVAPEKEINDWLKANPNIEIKNMHGNYDQVYIVYIEKGDNNDS